MWLPVSIEIFFKNIAAVQKGNKVHARLLYLANRKKMKTNVERYF